VFELALPDRFRATFAAAKYTLHLTTTGKGRAEVRIRHGIDRRERSKWLVVRQNAPGPTLGVTDPPVSSCGGTHVFVIDLELRASAKSASESAKARVASIELDTGANDMIALEPCK
jgi:hypothetical protein